MAPSFKFLLKAWQENQVDQSSRIMKFYGSEQEWTSIVQSKIDGDQLGIRFGGSKERNL